MAVGYIYVLTNPAMPGLVKIGHTTDVERRVKELSLATGVPRTFVVELFQLTADAAETEGLIHASLDSHRYSENREFFEVSLSVAIAAVRGQIRDVQLQYQRLQDDPLTAEPKWSCRRCGFEYDRSLEHRFCPKCQF
jgi:predicted Zn-ribbon and HTH transcriptional regulator